MILGPRVLIPSRSGRGPDGGQRCFPAPESPVLIPSRSGRGPDSIPPPSLKAPPFLNPFSIRARSGPTDAKGLPWPVVLIPSRSGRGPDSTRDRIELDGVVLIPSRSGRGPDVS